jgi:hypothetical protein
LNKRSVHFIFSPAGGAGCSSIALGLQQSTPNSIPFDADRYRMSLRQFKEANVATIGSGKDISDEVYLENVFRKIGEKLQEKEECHIFVDLSRCLLKSFFEAIVSYDISNYFEKDFNAKFYLHGVFSPEMKKDFLLTITRLRDVSKHLSEGSVILWMNRFRSPFFFEMEGEFDQAKTVLGSKLLAIFEIPFSELTQRYVIEQIIEPRYTFAQALENCDALSRGRLKAYMSLYQEASEKIFSEEAASAGGTPPESAVVEESDTSEEDDTQDDEAPTSSSENEEKEDAEPESEEDKQEESKPAINIEGGEDEDEEELEYGD